MGHKNIALCSILVLTSSCAIGMRTHQTYASDPNGTATKIGGGRQTVTSDDGKVVEKDTAPKALQTGGSNELYVAFARDTHSMDNAETSIEKRTPFVENGSAEMVGNPYGYGGVAYNPVYAAAAAYMQSQSQPVVLNAAPSAPQTSPAELQKLTQAVKDAHDASVLNQNDVAELRTDVDDHEERICKKEGKDCKKKPAKRPE